MATVVKGKGWR